VLAREVAGTEALSASRSLLEYDDRCKNNYMYRLEQQLVKVKEYLATRNESLLRAITKEQI